MTNDLARFHPGVTRVVCPGGIRGTVEKVSERPNARWPILVKQDDLQVRSYAASELTVLAVEAKQPWGPMP